MTTSDAIRGLRKTLALSQRDFAATLGIAPRSVLRYEAGAEPGQRILRKLADLSARNGIGHLSDLFVAQLRAVTISRVRSLPSAGTARKVPPEDIERWRDANRRIRKQALQMAARPNPPAWNELQGWLKCLAAELFVSESDQTLFVTQAREHDSRAESAAALQKLPPAERERIEALVAEQRARIFAEHGIRDPDAMPSGEPDDPTAD